MKIDEIEKYYNEHFNVAFDYAQIFEDSDYKIYDAESGSFCKKIIIKDENAKCRFCGKKEPEVTFKNTPHSISETLGNKRIIGEKNECDRCNSHFSAYENDLTNFLLPYLILNGICGKKGQRKYKTLNGESKFFTRDDIIRIEEIQGFSRVSEDIEKHEMTYTYYCSGYRLLSIYKILVKMALSLLPENEYKKFTITALNISSESYRITGLEKIRFTVYTGLNVFELNARGYLKKDSNPLVPDYVFYLCCGNFSFQVFILSDEEIKKHNMGDRVQFDFYGLDDLETEINSHKPTSYFIDCQSDEIVDKKMKTITLHYDEKTEVNVNEGSESIS